MTKYRPEIQKNNEHAAYSLFRESAAFTLLELLVVITIIGILASVVLASISDVRDQAYTTRAKVEFRVIYQALQGYQNKYGSMPPDAVRDIPPGLEEFLAPGIWPNAAWPGSVFDWDNWEDRDNPDEPILQISVRFCPIGSPSGCQFPNDDWAEDFQVDSAVYYCISGSCRSHENEPIDYPGYCVNCPH